MATLNEWASLTGTDPGSGVVDLDANLRDGDTRGSIGVTVRDYAVGGYTVSAVTVSSNSTIVLGSLNVKNGFGRRKTTTGVAHFGGAQNPFPSGFSPFDVALVSITDWNGNVVSSGTLTPVQDGYLNAISPLISSTGQATGYALIRADGPPPAASVVSAASGDEGIDDGAGSLTINSGGTEVLSGLNIYTVGTGVVTGSLGVSGSTLIIVGSPIYTDNGGTLTVAGTAGTTGTLGLSGSCPTLTSGSLTFSGSTTITSGSLTLNTGGDLSGGVLDVSGATLTLNSGIEGGLNLAILSGSLSISGSTFTTVPSFAGTTLTIDGSDINGGTLTLSGSFPPVTNGLLTLSGTCPPIVSGSLAWASGGSLLLSSSNLNGVTVVISGSLTLATGTPALDGSSVLLSGTVVNPDPPETATLLHAKSDTPAASTKTKDTVDAPAPPSPVTGELVIHAQGLPSSASVTYFADGTEIGTGTTDKAGNLIVRAIQGGENGTLPDTVDLYSVQTVTIEDALGDVLLTAEF